MGKVVRTFLPYSKIVKKPLPHSIPDNPKTIGEHIRKKRIENGLLQRDVAKCLRASEDTLTGWENNRSQPQVQFYPRIISFLGYYPFVEETETIGGVLRMSRRMYGFSQKQMGELIGVDGTTVRSWELDLTTPNEVILKKYYELRA